MGLSGWQFIFGVVIGDEELPQTPAGVASASRRLADFQGPQQEAVNGAPVNVGSMWN
jgi:hypothetical protein